MNRERDYLEFQRYLEAKRQNISPALGEAATSAANIFIAPFGLGVIEASEPRATYIEKHIENEAPHTPDTTFSHELGLRTLRQTVLYIDTSPRSALRELSRTELGTAA